MTRAVDRWAGGLPSGPERRREHAALVRAIVAWCDGTGLAHAVPVDVARRRGWGATLGTAGTPDVLVFLPPRGRCIGLEVKIPPDKPRDSQVEWARRAADFGVATYLVQTLDAAIEAIRECAAEERPRADHRTKLLVTNEK